MKKFIKLISATIVCAMAIFCLTACAPANADKADLKMTNAGYTSSIDYVTASTFESTLFGYGVDGLSSGAKKVYAYNDDFENITIFYFENTADANRFYEIYVSLKADRWEKTDKQGKMVCYGTNAAYEVFAK